MSQQYHIPSELPSSSVHLVSPMKSSAKMMAPQMVNFGGAYEQRSIPIYQQQPPLQQQMQTSFQSSQHGDPQLLLMQLQGQQKQAQALAQGQRIIQQPQSMSYSQQQQPQYQHQYDQQQTHQYQQPTQQQYPQQQPQQQPIKTTPKVIRANLNVIQKTPRQDDQLQQQLKPVVSKREINFNGSQQQNKSQKLNIHEQQSNNGRSSVLTNDQEEQQQFKQTGDFGSQSTFQNQAFDHSNVRNQNLNHQKQHYDTSPNRPPTFSNNLKEGQQADADGTAAYQTHGKNRRRLPVQSVTAASPSQLSQQEQLPSQQAQSQQRTPRQQQQQLQRQTPANATNNRNSQPQSQVNAVQDSQNDEMVKIQLMHELSASQDVVLPSLDLHISQASIGNLFEILDQVKNVPRQKVTIGMIEHTKDALWLLNKVLADRNQTIESIFALKQNESRSQADLLTNLNQTLEVYYASQSELVHACLRVLVTYLQKLDLEGLSIPMNEVKNSNLLNQGLKKCLLLDPIGAAPSIHLTLKTLTQISFTCPQEIGKEVVTKVLEFCGSQDDSVAQENSIKLICNLLTNEKSCQVVLSVSNDVLEGVYQCLQSSSKSAVKFALGAILNLTLLKENMRIQSCENIMQTGGLSHLVCAIQKTYNVNDFESMHFGMKAFQNLVKYRAPVVKILTVDLGYLEIIFQLCRQMYQTVVKSTAQEQGRSDKAKQTKRRNDLLRVTIGICLGLLDSVAGSQGPSVNKDSLISEAGFLPFVNRMILLSVDKPAELYQATIQPILSHLQVLCRSAWKFSKRISEWEQEELTGNLLSLVESTDSDTILQDGLTVYICMQESGLLLSDEVQGRLKEINSQQNSSQIQLSNETKETLKRLIYLMHNTPFEKVSLTKEKTSQEEIEKLNLYKKAQQEASNFGKSFKQVPGQIVIPNISPLKKRLNPQEEGQNARLSEQASVYQLANNQAIIPVKNPRLSSRQSRKQSNSSRSYGGVPENNNSTTTTQKLSRNALNILDKQSNNSGYLRGNASIQDGSQYGNIDENHQVMLDKSSELQSNVTHQQMLNRLETVSLQESTRKGQSRALSLIAGSHNKTKPRGASSVAAIGGPLPPKIPPPTIGGNFIPASGKRDQNQAAFPKLNLASKEGLQYNKAEARSKSLIRGGGAHTQRPSGIGTGTNRLINNGYQNGLTTQAEVTTSRQRDFEHHIERFNKLEPLLKGQTIDYEPSNQSFSQQQRQKAHSTIQHSSYQVGGADDSSAAYNAINSIEDTRNKLGVSSPHGQQQLSTAKHNIYDIAPSVRSGGQFDQEQESNDQVPWQQLNYSRADSRGSELAVHLQSFGLKNSPIGNTQHSKQNNIQIQGEQQQPVMMSQQNLNESEGQPEVYTEYQQPTYESYYANQMKQNVGQSDFQPINPFASMDTPPAPGIIMNSSQQYLADKHQPPLASVSEEQEYSGQQHQYSNQRQQTSQNVAPQPLLQTKQNYRGPMSGNNNVVLQQAAQQNINGQQQQQQNMNGAAPKTIDEMVRQNQRIIAEKSQRRGGQQTKVPPQQAQQVSVTNTEGTKTAPIPQINASDYAGQEQDLVKKYSDVNLMDKDSIEARQARFQMGIGMPEARAILKRTNGGSFRQQVEWFAQTCAHAGQAQAFNEVKQAVCSTQNTQKLVSLYILAAHQMGFPMGDFFTYQ